MDEPSTNFGIIVHAHTPTEIAAVLRRAHDEAVTGGGLAAVWIELPNGRMQMQIVLDLPVVHSRSALTVTSQRCPAESMASLTHEIREALRLFGNAPALARCRLLQRIDVAAHVVPGDIPSCSHGLALQRVILSGIAQLDERSSRRSISFGQVFDCVRVRRLTQEQTAEILNIEDRTVWRALHELAPALAALWTQSAEIELSA